MNYKGHLQERRLGKGAVSGSRRGRLGNRAGSSRESGGVGSGIRWRVVSGIKQGRLGNRERFRESFRVGSGIRYRASQKMVDSEQLCLFQFPVERS